MKKKKTKTSKKNKKKNYLKIKRPTLTEFENAWVSLGLLIYALFLSLLIMNLFLNFGTYSILFFAIFLLGGTYLKRLSRKPEKFVREMLFVAIALLAVESSIQPFLTPKTTISTELSEIYVLDNGNVEYIYSNTANVKTPIIALAFSALPLVVDEFEFLCDSISINGQITSIEDIEDVFLYSQNKSISKISKIYICPKKSALQIPYSSFRYKTKIAAPLNETDFSMCSRFKGEYNLTVWGGNTSSIRFVILSLKNTSVPVTYYFLKFAKIESCDDNEDVYIRLLEKYFEYDCMRAGNYFPKTNSTEYFNDGISIRDKNKSFDEIFPYSSARFEYEGEEVIAQIDFYNAEKCSRWH